MSKLGDAVKESVSRDSLGLGQDRDPNDAAPVDEQWDLWFDFEGPPDAQVQAPSPVSPPVPAPQISSESAYAFELPALDVDLPALDVELPAVPAAISGDRKAPGLAGPAPKSPRAQEDTEPAPPFGTLNGLRAVLRWRAHLQRQLAPAAMRLTMNFAPALFHASFRTRGLDDSPPGISGMHMPRGWGDLARAFHLPAPHRAAPGRPMIETMFALPRAEALEIHLVCAPWLREVERARLDLRSERAAEVLSHKFPTSIRLHTHGKLQGTHAPWPAIFLFGTLQAGAPENDTLESLMQGALTEEDLVALIVATESPLHRLLLLRLLGQTRSTPARVLGAAFDAGQQARTLAHLSVSAALFSGESSAIVQELLRLALRLDSLNSVSPERGALRRALKTLVGHDEETGSGEALDALGLEETLALGGRLCVDLLKALKRSKARRDPARQRWIRKEVGGLGIPPALFPLLARNLGREGWRVGPTEHGFQVLHPNGARLLRVSTEVLARARAIDLATQVHGEAIDPTGGGRAWERVAGFLAAPSERISRLAIIAPSYSSGEDPLNAGTHRSLALGGATVVTRRPGRRVFTRQLHRHQLLRWILDAGRRGESLELRPQQPSAATTVGRLTEILRFQRKARALKIPAAIEADGHIHLLDETQHRTRPALSFALRPQCCLPDPRSPTLQLRDGPPPKQTRPLMLHVEVHLREELGPAVISYRGPGLWLLREPIPLEALGRWLAETQRLVSACDPPALMALVADGAVEQAMTRRGLTRPPDATLAIEGELPFSLRCFCEGEVFGSGSSMGWQALALALLSRVPSGRMPQLSFTEVELMNAGMPAAPMLRLYARSLVYRRLQAWFARLG